MNLKLQQLQERHAASSFDKQLWLDELVGERAWEFDMEGGVLRFGDEYPWKTQVLGTESEETNTWKWAWANTESGIPGNLLKAARGMRNFGKEHGILQLSQEQFEMGEINGEMLAMMASGAIHANAYYRAPYENGAVYLLVMDEEYPHNIVEPLVRVSSVFPQFISHYPIDHKKAFLGYLKYYGIPASIEDGEVLGADSNGDRIRAAFDEKGRLVRIGMLANPKVVA